MRRAAFDFSRFAPCIGSGIIQGLNLAPDGLFAFRQAAGGLGCGLMRLGGILGGNGGRFAFSGNVFEPVALF